MTLGTDNTICKNEFIAAVRADLEAEKPGSGTNADNPDVQKMFGMLSQAVYQIATTHAESIADASADPNFWTWVVDVNRWLVALSNWQRGVAQAASNWNPTLPAEQALKASLTAPLNPTSPPTVPPSLLKGRIR